MSRMPLPTDAELEILAVLWRDGPSTVRHVHEALGVSTGYTTILKLMQIMLDKGLVRRDESSRAHVYVARQAQQTTQRQLIGNLVKRAFRGSASELVMSALSARPASKQELDAIRKLLDDLDAGGER